MLDALLEVLLFGEARERVLANEIDRRTSEFIALLSASPVTDFEAAFGGPPALARAGNAKALGEVLTTLDSRLAPLLERLRGRGATLGDFLVYAIANPDSLPFEEWRRSALTFDRHLGTYR